MYQGNPPALLTVTQGIELILQGISSLWKASCAQCRWLHTDLVICGWVGSLAEWQIARCLPFAEHSCPLWSCHMRWLQQGRQHDAQLQLRRPCETMGHRDWQVPQDNNRQQQPTRFPCKILPQRKIHTDGNLGWATQGLGLREAKADQEIYRFCSAHWSQNPDQMVASLTSFCSWVQVYEIGPVTKDISQDRYCCWSVWDAFTGTSLSCEKQLIWSRYACAGHTNTSLCMFSCFIVHHPRGVFLLTGSEDNSINIYELNSQEVSFSSSSHQISIVSASLLQLVPKLPFQSGIQNIIYWEEKMPLYLDFGLFAAYPHVVSWPLQRWSGS